MITNWSEMPIGILERIKVIGELHRSDDEKTFMVAALLAGMDYEKFIELPLSEATELMSHIKFISTMPKRKRVKKEYNIGTRTYTLFKDMTKITTAQYIDFQSIVTTSENISEILGIALIPKGCEYGVGYDKEEIIDEIMDNLNVEEALGIVDFFTRRCERSMTLQMLKAQATITTARIMSKGTEKKLLRATEKLINLKAKELRQGFGYRWWKRWPK